MIERGFTESIYTEERVFTLANSTPEGVSDAEVDQAVIDFLTGDVTPPDNILVNELPVVRKKPVPTEPVEPDQPYIELPISTEAVLKVAETAEAPIKLLIPDKTPRSSRLNRLLRRKGNQEILVEPHVSVDEKSNSTQIEQTVIDFARDGNFPSNIIVGHEEFNGAKLHASTLTAAQQTGDIEVTLFEPHTEELPAIAD